MRRRLKRESFEDIVRWAIRRACGGHEIDDDDSLYNDLGLDSLDLVEVEMAVERKAGCHRLSSSEVDRNTTVMDLINMFYDQYMEDRR